VAKADESILAFIQRLMDDPDMGHGLTFRNMGRAVGLSGSALHQRLKLMQECGVVTFERGQVKTLKLINADLQLLKQRAPIGRPRGAGYCSVHGCQHQRNGDQWCCQHEIEFVERYRRKAG
jgi:hypothetical protein